MEARAKAAEDARAKVKILQSPLHSDFSESIECLVDFLRILQAEADAAAAAKALANAQVCVAVCVAVCHQVCVAVWVSVCVAVWTVVWVAVGVAVCVTVQNINTDTRSNIYNFADAQAVAA